MIEIILGNRISKISRGEEDRIPFSELHRTCSFFVKGAQFSNAFKRKKWDGRKYLYNPATHTFPTGLLNIVEKILKKNNIKYNLNDQRIEPPPVPFSKAFASPKFQLRYYQNETVKKLKEEKRGVISIGTGGGKTKLFLEAIAQLKYKSLVVVPTKELLYQTTEMMKEDYSFSPGLVGDGHWEPNLICTIALIHTLYSRERRKDPHFFEFIKGVEVLVIDEFHRAASMMYQRVLRHCNAYYRFGFTATNFRTDGADLVLQGLTGREIIDIPSRELIEMGYLAPAEVWFFAINEPQLSGLSYSEAYEEGIVHNKFRNLKIALILRSFNRKNWKTMILVNRVQHGKFLSQLCEGSIFVWGELDSKVRNSALREFRDGKLKCLIGTTGIFGEGINVPDMNALILAGGGQAKKDVIQRAGRALRKTETKEKAIIVDFLDFTDSYLSKHSLSRLKVFREQGFPVKIKEGG